MHYLLIYETAENFVEHRAPYRAEHLALAWAASQRGELILGGPFADPMDGAALLFDGKSPAVAEDFARSDPYVMHGLIRRWTVRTWNTAVGEYAANPVREA